MKSADRIIVITGASRGLGREMALRLCRRNSKLVLIARAKSLLEQVQRDVESLSGEKPLIIPCDISDEAGVNQMAKAISEKFEYIDVLVNNAAVAIHKASGEMSNEEMRRQFEVNFFGPFYCLKALLPLLKASRSAYILNVNSMVSGFAFADNSVYAATKSALMRFSEGLRRELKESNVRVGSFFPGLMKTSFQSDRKDGYKFPPLITVGPEIAAVKIEKMIIGKKKKAYIRRYTIAILMKIKQWIG